MESDAKLKRLLATIGEFMGETIETEQIIMTRAKVPDDRADVATVIQRIAAAQRKKIANGNSKPAAKP